MKTLIELDVNIKEVKETGAWATELCNPEILEWHDEMVATKGRASTAAPASTRRTIVCGAFPYGTRREEIVRVLQLLCGQTGARGIEEVYAPSTRATVGFIKFESAKNMWAWVHSMKTKELQHGGERLWWTVESPQEERERKKATWDLCKFVTPMLPADAQPHIEPVTNKSEIWIKKVLVYKVDGESGVPRVNAKLLNRLCGQEYTEEQWLEEASRAAL